MPGARENVWAYLLEAGVDRISTDDLAAFKRFLRRDARCLPTSPAEAGGGRSRAGTCTSRR